MPRHALWSCPCLGEVYKGQAAVQKTHVHALEAVGPHHLQCFWLPGLMPQRVLSEHITSHPPNIALAHFVGSLPEWPLGGGEYHTDASGGKHGSDPLLHRVGCGFAFLVPSNCNYSV